MYRHVGPKTHYQMREKLASIGDDSWIEDDRGNKVFKVNGKAMHIRDTFVLEDAERERGPKVQDVELPYRNTMAIAAMGRRSRPSTGASSDSGSLAGRDRGRSRHEGAREPRRPRVRDRRRAREGRCDLEEVVPVARHVRRGLEADQTTR